MPKKFASENTKAVAARERKKNAKEAELTKIKKAAEDAAWKDEDKNILKKKQRKDEMEKKKQQQLDRKAEARALLEKEMVSINPKKTPPPIKVTRAQINQCSQVKQAKKEEDKLDTHLDSPLEENLNRLTIDEEQARNVTEAIAILSSESKETDLHPEKRMKAAYATFEERRLKELKMEYPSLRLSQLKQIIFKEWQKSPDNPLNSN